MFDPNARYAEEWKELHECMEYHGLFPGQPPVKDKEWETKIVKRTDTEFPRLDRGEKPMYFVKQNEERAQRARDGLPAKAKIDMDRHIWNALSDYEREEFEEYQRRGKEESYLYVAKTGSCLVISPDVIWPDKPLNPAPIRLHGYNREFIQTFNLGQQSPLEHVEVAEAFNRFVENTVLRNNPDALTYKTYALIYYTRPKQGLVPYGLWGKNELASMCHGKVLEGAVGKAYIVAYDETAGKEERYKPIPMWDQFLLIDCFKKMREAAIEYKAEEQEVLRKRMQIRRVK